MPGQHGGVDGRWIVGMEIPLTATAAAQRVKPNVQRRMCGQANTHGASAEAVQFKVRQEVRG